MPRYEAKKEQKNPNGFRKSIDGSHYYRIGWDSIKAIKLLPNPQKKNCLYIFSCSKTQKVFTLLHLSSFYFLFFRFVFFFFFTIFDDEGPRSDEGWILPPHSKRFNHITSKELDKNRQTLRLVCVCVNSKYFYVSSKRKSPASMCDVSKPIVCIIRIFFSHPPPPLACLSAGRLDFGDGWFVKKHRQVTLLFSYVLADSRTFLIPPCATHENPFPLEGLPMQLTGPFFLLFFPFPSSFIFYSMVAGWIYNNGFSPTNRKKKIFLYTVDAVRTVYLIRLLPFLFFL